MSPIPRPEADKLHAQIGKLLAETALTLQEIRASTARANKLDAEARSHPYIVAAGMMTAGGAIVTALATIIAKIIA